MLRQLNIHNQVVIPKNFVERLKVRPKDYVDVSLRNGTIILRPVSVEEVYTQEDIHKLEKIFANPKNRGTKLTAEQFKKHIETL